MNDNIFFDTNILLYSYSIDDDTKKIVSRELINRYQGIISTQMLQELCNILIKKLKFDEASIFKVLEEVNENLNVITNDLKIIQRALNLHFRYAYSYYDSLIIACALQNNCSVFYSEDLQHNQKIEKNLTIINSFIQNANKKRLDKRRNL